MSGPGSCRRPPEGWYCTLPDGHIGPCPAWPIGRREALAQAFMVMKKPDADIEGTAWAMADIAVRALAECDAVVDPFPPDLRDALGMLRATAGHCLTLAGYEIRPFDMLADRRRWRWQRRHPCQSTDGVPAVLRRWKRDR